jgi:predicted molibdopterin-dependent oxidoreductase YjgC
MLYQYNISTRQSAILDSLASHEQTEINPEDARSIGLKDGDELRVTSRRGSVVTRAKVTERVPAGILFMTFHFSETAANELTNSASDPISKTAEYKVCAIRIEKVSEVQ